MREKFIFSICLFFLFGYTTSLHAQVKPLDNWDLEVVGKKVLQSDTYLDLINTTEIDQLGANTTLRYGIANNYELQLTWNSERFDFPGKTESGQNSRLGVKAFLNKESTYLPGFSAILSANLTTDPESTPILPALNVLFRKGLFNNFTLTGNYQLIVDEQESELFYDFAVNLDVEMTEWLMVYAGIKGIKSATTPYSGFHNNEYVELGALFWVADQFRFYPYYNIGLEERTENIINLGFLYQFK